jgi:hypothetical protein
VTGSLNHITTPYFRDLTARQRQGRVLIRAWLQWFDRHSVAATTLAFSPAGHADMLLADSVAWSRDGTMFAFDDEGGGEGALTFLVRNRLGELQDVVAWQPKTGRVATLLGRACMIGADQLDAPRLGEGLRVCEDTLQWLQARRMAVVILDPKRALPQLLDVGPLLAASFEHGRELREMLELSLPPILVPSEPRREAA